MNDSKLDSLPRDIDEYFEGNDDAEGETYIHQI